MGNVDRSMLGVVDGDGAGDDGVDGEGVAAAPAFGARRGAVLVELLPPSTSTTKEPRCVRTWHE